VIAPPNRPAAARSPLSASAAPAVPDPDGAPDAPETQAALNARIAALVARATTPEDEALERQREEFDFVTRVQAESDREINALRDMAMEQMKQDDELLKKWIALI
jgi:hypothetical protein